MKQLLFIILLTLALIFALAPTLFRTGCGSDKARAINNAKQIGIAMTEFESHYGHFPTPDQHEDFLEDYPIQNRDDSNYILGQLLASKVLDSEKVFYINGREGDDVFHTPQENLKAGECEFSYISKAGRVHLSEQDFPSETPIVLGPMIAGSNLFDPDYLGKSHQMVFLKIDSSVGICTIDQTGKALIKGEEQRGLLDTGKGSIWGDRVPTIHHPLSYLDEPNTNFLKKRQSRKTSKNILLITLCLTTFSISIILLRRKNRMPIES
jgi:hypothetical protein